MRSYLMVSVGILCAYEIDYINKETRPKFIRYCKIYIDMKKAHAKELRTTGHIRYNKVDENALS